MIDYYVKEIMQEIRMDSCVTTPRIMRKLLRGGPCRSEENIFHLFGGKRRFRSTCRRLDLLRWAVSTSTMEGMPLEAWGPEDPEYQQGERGIPVRQPRYIGWWAPSVWGRKLYDGEHRLPEVPALVRRYPGQEDSDEYFDWALTESESGGSDEEMAMAT